MTNSSKHFSTALKWALPVLGVVYTTGCSSSPSATRQSGGSGSNGAATVIAAGGSGDSAGGGAAGGANDAGTTIGGAGGSGDSAGAIFGGAGGASSVCEIGLQKFENNGYRSCAASDIAEIAGDCGPEFNNEYGDTETCGALRIHAYGHDGRIGCAYDSATGALVGGFLYGIPVPGMSCSSYFAGPAALATCPIPNTPFCRAP